MVIVRGIHMRKLYVKIGILTMVFCILIGTTTNNVKAIEKRNILFISSYNPNFISFNDHVNGIKDGLNNEVQLQIEYMDFKTFDSKENEENFYNLLKYKLSTYNEFEAIVLGDDEALAFAIKYRDELFKDIPLVFLAVSDERLIQEAISLDMVSGVKELESVNDNIELIKKFHKNVKNITVLEQNNEEDRLTWLYNNAVEAYPDINFQRIVTKEITIDNLKEVVSTLDGDDAILLFYPNTYINKSGLLPPETTKVISDNTNVPIYSVLSYGIGYGSIGGRVINHYQQGKIAGGIVKDILEGKNPRDLYIGDDKGNEYIFDYNMLNKFFITESQLPDGAIILNKPIPFWEKYKNIIPPLLLVLIGLVSIIVALLLYVLNRIRYEEELLRAKEIAENANKAKGHFISNISHELRTPIAVIMSANQLSQLKLKNYGEEQYGSCGDNFNTISQNCYRLLRLTNNIIDVAKVESGFMDLRLKNINAVELFEGIVLSVVPYADTKNIDVIFDTTDEEIDMALDWEKMERVVLNLLSNAIKFSKENGMIMTHLQKKGNSIIFTVEDSGIGIDKENLDKIFERFVQVDDTLTRKTEGSGIGLALAKAFVEMHNGTINVESSLGEGTRFTIEIPIIKVEGETIDDLQIKDEESSTIVSTKVEFSDIYF